MATGGAKLHDLDGPFEKRDANEKNAPNEDEEKELGEKHTEKKMNCSQK